MDQPYSVIADWLSKFHTWPESIQALWLIAVPVTLLGVTWIVMRGLRDAVAAWRGREGRLVYGVEDAEPVPIWRDGEARAVEDRSLLPSPSTSSTPSALSPPSPSSPDLFRGPTS